MALENTRKLTEEAFHFDATLLYWPTKDMTLQLAEHLTMPVAVAFTSRYDGHCARCRGEEAHAAMTGHDAFQERLHPEEAASRTGRELIRL